MMRPAIPTLILAIFAGSSVSDPVFRPYIDEAEPPVPASVKDRDATWKEGTTPLPPWPNDSDLVEFVVDDPESRFRQYIDSKHLTVGADGAVRYTLVVDSESGARNVSYEGLRCTPKGLFKIYAYGYDGHFEKSDGEWMRIEGRAGDRIHSDLHKLILCSPRTFLPLPKKDMLRAMKGRVPSHVGTLLPSD